MGNLCCVNKEIVEADMKNEQVIEHEEVLTFQENEGENS